jgi:hypothetical protein
LEGASTDLLALHQPRGVPDGQRLNYSLTSSKTSPSWNKT